MTGLPIVGKRPAVRLPVANRNKPSVGNDGPLWISPCIPIAGVSIHERLRWITCPSARFSRLRISGRLNRSPTPPTSYSTKLQRPLCLARYSSQSKRELSGRFDAHACCPMRRCRSPSAWHAVRNGSSPAHPQNTAQDSTSNFSSWFIAPSSKNLALGATAPLNRRTAREQ
jgi:hypothetical protein